MCHREQQAKRGYKFASILINTCLATQVVVAAALTALGAANSSHTAVTAFGAINTMIAGILTYLKGSGLPNRIRYYENEWKRVREYIEQRERDLSRPNCTLDVYEIVKTVEAMYLEVQMDIQTNTPDNYISVGDLRNRAAASTHPIPRIGDLRNSIHPHAFGSPRGKLEELEMKYGHRVADMLDGLARKEEERLVSLEKELEDRKNGVLKKGEDIEKDIESGGSRLVELAKDAKKETVERRERLSRIGEELKEEMHIHRQE